MALPQLNSGASRTPQTLTGVNVIIDGVGHLGTSKSVTLPKVSFETREQEFGGVTRHIDMGTLQAMECEITLEEYSPVVYAALALRKVSDLVIFLNADAVQNGKNVHFHAVLKGPVSELDDGELSAKKEIERKLMVKVNQYVLEIDGTQGILVDTDNLICMINGVDLLAQTRTNLAG